MRTIRGAQRRTIESAGLVVTLAGYWTTVFPAVRRELARWRAAATAIPDADVRALALRTLDEEGGLAEGAAIFATLVPGRAARRRLVRLLVAWQVAYDYLDTLGERVAADAPRAGEGLYAPLLLALDPGASLEPLADMPDGGYLARLVACCRANVAALPSFPAVMPVALRAARRCAEAQTRTHAVAALGPGELREWALAQPGAERYRWWEVAAGAISSLSVHAVLATAALPRTETGDAARVDAAYFPSICALSTLLDSTIDAADDDGTANHRCTAYYASADEAAERIEAIARIAAAAARALPRGRGHAVILAGMTAYYAAAGWDGHERVHGRVAGALDLGTGPVLWTLRVRRAARRGDGEDVAAGRDAPPSPRVRGDGCGDGGCVAGPWSRARSDRAAPTLRGPTTNAPARRRGISAEDGSAKEAPSGAFGLWGDLE